MRWWRRPQKKPAWPLQPQRVLTNERALSYAICSTHPQSYAQALQDRGMALSMCLLTQSVDCGSRAAGILARARLLLVVASIIRGDGPNELCESIEPISARERCLKNNALHASRLLRWSCAGGCPRQVTEAHVERPSARYRPGRSPGGARAPSGPIGRLRVAASGCQRLRHPGRPSAKKTRSPTRR